MPGYGAGWLATPEHSRILYFTFAFLVEADVVLLISVIEVSIVKRIIVFCYGVICYAAFLGSFLYAIGFLGNFGVPKSIDSGRSDSLPVALAINAGLLALFAVQHSGMARPAFKRMWTRIVPEEAERSTYVLLSSVALSFVFWQWRPIGGVVWNVESPSLSLAFLILYGFGLAIVLVSTFLIDHFDLFGMRQVYLYLLRRPYTHLEFRTPFFYKYVRHPLYVGWLLTFWSAPVMTSAHLFFALMTTIYIFIAIRFEEADLLAAHGDRYQRYRDEVPMIMPALPKSQRSSDAHKLFANSSAGTRNSK